MLGLIDVRELEDDGKFYHVNEIRAFVSWNLVFLSIASPFLFISALSYNTRCAFYNGRALCSNTPTIR